MKEAKQRFNVGDKVRWDPPANMWIYRGDKRFGNNVGVITKVKQDKTTEYYGEKQKNVIDIEYYVDFDDKGGKKKEFLFTEFAIPSEHKSNNRSAQFLKRMWL